jgi:asparagine synthase (glutamine-hydrolysing)
MPSLPYYYDEPFGDQSALPTTLVCKMAREKVTVALSADGGDEVFAGYNRYDYLIKYGRILNSFPGFLRKATSGIMNSVAADKIPILKNKYNFHNRYEKLKQLLKDPSPENIMLSLSRQYDEKQLKELFRHEIKNTDTSYLSDELLPEYFTPLSYMMAIDYQTYLLDDILQKVDRASMSTSLEAREPFLDHRIIEWAARLPDKYKYSNGIKKYILKEIVHEHLPKVIMDKPKMGFAIPIENWLTHELRDQVSYYLDPERLRKQKIFEPDIVQKMVSNFFSGKKELAVKVWYMLMFQLWFEKWMR